MYRAFRTERYERELKKLGLYQRRVISHFEQKLKRDPFLSKPLGYFFFREKKYDDKRILFLVYEEYKVILFVALTNKKEQQKDIDTILEDLESYKEEMKRKLNLSNSSMTEIL